MRSEIKRWGNSAAVRLPSKLLAEARLEVNSAVSMVVKGRKIIIEASGETKPKRLKLPFSEAELIFDMNPKTSHADEIAMPSDPEIGDQ
jgi:antitoxin MazE